jgi:tetratricopeptide (TPR) repeat protein
MHKTEEHFPGRVQRVGGTGVAHATVQVEGAGSTVTTDSGEFQFDPPKNVHVGEIVIFHVVNWVITSPCELSNGHVYLHTPKEPMEIYVLPPGDPLLTAPSTNLIPCIIEERTGNLRLGIGGASAGQTRKTGHTLTHLRAKHAEYNPVSRGRLLRASYDPNAQSSPEPPSQTSMARPSDDPFLVQKASELGISVNQLQVAIDAWKASASGPYQRGLAELYDGQFAGARKHIQEALDQPGGDILTRYVFLGTAAYWEGDYAAAEKAFRKVLAIHPDDPIVLSNLAVVLTSEVQFEEAETLYSKAIAIATTAGSAEEPDVAAYQHNLAEVYVESGQYLKAEHFSQAALQLEEKLYGPKDWRVAGDFECLGLVSRGLGKLDEAITFDLEAKNIYGDTASPSLARVLNNLASVYLEKGKDEEGYPLAQRAVEMGREVLPPGHPDLATYRANLGWFELHRGHDESALRQFKTALLNHIKRPGRESLAVAQDYFNLAAFYSSRMEDENKKKVDDKKAQNLFHQALNTAQSILGKDDPNLVTFINGLGNSYFIEGKYADARRQFKRALYSDKKTFGESHMFVARDISYLATVSLKLHEYRDAASQFKNALAITKVAIMPQQFVANMLDGAAESLNALGDKDEAKGYEDQAAGIRKQGH